MGSSIFENNNQVVHILSKRVSGFSALLVMIKICRTAIGIVFQLSKNFLLYVVIGLLIAAPIAWMQMNEWLNNFEYRIEMQWWMIALAGVLAIGIAFLIVGSKTIVAALTNPVESLRNE